MSEKKFQVMVLALFHAKNAHAINMEPGTTNPGIPDINWCIKGIEGNLELKFGHDPGAAPHIRPPQVVWFRDRIKAGGYPMLAYYIEELDALDGVYIFQGRYIEELAMCKDIDEIFDIEYLRVINPNEMIEALVSEMASWQDQTNPPVTTH